MSSWDISAVQTALITWASSESGVTFVMAGQHHERPSLPYGTLQFIGGPTSRAMFEEDQSFDSGSLTRKAGTIASMTTRLQVFSQSQSGATSARALLEGLSASLEKISVLETFAASNISPHSTPIVQDLSEVSDNIVRGRASMDVTFNIPLRITESISWIDTVEGTGEVDDRTTTIEVDV